MPLPRRWWNTHIGGDRTHMVGVRVSKEEDDRLEELRRLLRLRSSSEVLRFALQVVECACAGNPINAQSPDALVGCVEECLQSDG